MWYNASLKHIVIWISGSVVGIGYQWVELGYLQYWNKYEERTSFVDGNIRGTLAL